MKKYLLLPLIIISFFSYSQQKQFNISWEDEAEVLETETSRIEIPSFDKKHFSFLREQGLKFFAQWDESSYLNEDSVELSQVVYQNISISDLKDLPLSTVPKVPKVTLRNAIDRDNINAYLEVTPIINDRGVYKKITAFTINYQYAGALNRSAQNNQEITNSVLSSGSWQKFFKRIRS